MKPSICGWKTGGPFLILAICKSKVNNLVEFSLQRCHSLHTWVSIMSYTKTQKPQKQAFPWFWHDLDASVMSTLCQDTGQHASIFSWCQNLFNNRKLRHDSFIGSTLPDYPNCLENSDPDNNIIFCLFVCLWVFAWMCICASQACVVPTEVRDGTRSPGSEFQAVVSCHMGPGNTTQVLWKKGF